MLVLPIKKQWFDMIKSGEKTEEYREYKPYWISRIENNKDGVVQLKNGYHKDAPVLYANYVASIKDKGKEEWGAPQSGVFFTLSLFNVREKR